MIYLKILAAAHPAQIPKLLLYLLLSGLYRGVGWRPFEEMELAFRELRFCGEVGGNSGLKFAYGIAGAEEYAAFPFGKIETGDVLYDCGAHCGFFGIYYAQKHPDLQVVAFEPHPRTFSLLERNIRANGLGKQITAVQAAVGSAEGTTTIEIDEGSTMAVVHDSELSATENATQQQTGEEVALTTLDAYASASGTLPRYLKVDVEGYEGELLLGASDCLSATSGLVIETHSPELDAQCMEIVKKAGFAIERGNGDLDDDLIFGSKQA